jgi:WD40 repeat protein
VKQRLALPIVLVACSWLREYSGPHDPREPAPLAIEELQPGVMPPCTATLRPVIGDARWRPSVSGGVGVVDVRGEPRLTIDDYAVLAWSPDAARLAVADRKAVVIWSARDGALLDLVPYGVGDVAVASIAWSRDGRWIALSGSQRRGGSDAPSLLLVELAAGKASRLHVIDLASSDRGGYRGVAAGVLSRAEPLAARGATVRVSAKHDAVELVDSSGAVRTVSAYDPESALALVDGGARLLVARPGKLSVFDLPAGTLVREVPLPGTEMVALSPDGRRVAGWTLARVQFLGKRAGAQAAPAKPLPTPFIAMWDVASGRQLWQDTTRCCDTWEFSAEGQWLVPPWHRLGSELIATATGHVMTYPGRVMSVSPNGQLAAIATRDGLELWTTAGKLAVGPVRGPVVVARGANGAVAEVLARAQPLSRGIVIDLGTGASVLEVGNRCTTVFDARTTSDQHGFAFSDDGSQLYAARWSEAGSDASLVRVADGQSLRAIHASGNHRVIASPTLARFVVEVAAGVRIVDASTGREVASAPAPRVSYSRGPGLVWDVRDPDGERTSHFGSLVVDANGRHLVGSTALHNDVVTIWDLQNVGRTIDLSVRGIVSVLAISADGAHIAAADRDGHVTAWSGSAHSPRTLPESRGWIRALAFSPTSKLLATGSDDGTVRIIDMTNGSSLGEATLAADRPYLLTWLDARTLVVDSARHLVITLSMNAR